MNEPRRLRVAIYARVSTDDGEQDPTQQLEPCRREAERRGLDIVWEGCDMVSGTVELWNRRRGADLWKLIKNRAVDVVLTYDSSRLSRESPGAVFDLIHKLDRHGVGYVSATESILDTSSDNDFRDLVLSITAWANNFLVKQLRRSTKRGKAASKLRGIPQGRHRNGCGMTHPCPTGSHGPDGQPVRPPRGKSWASRKPTPPESLPPETTAGPAASPPTPQGA